MKHCYNIVIFAILALTACEREIPYSGEYQDAGLVMQALMYSGSDTICCFVNRSYFFLDAKPANPQPLTDLSFEISSSRTDMRIIHVVADGNKRLLKLSSHIQAGDTVQLTVSHPQFGTAEATEITMPPFVPDNLSVILDTTDANSWWWHFNLQLPDYAFPQSVIGVYAMEYYADSIIIAHYNKEDRSFLRWDTIVSRHVFATCQSQDNIFAIDNLSHEDTYYGLPQRPLTFSADYPSAKQLTLSMHAPRIETLTNFVYPEYMIDRRLDSLHLCFEVYGETYNQYLASMRKYFDTGGEKPEYTDVGSYVFTTIGMQEEPVPLYSNVTCGYGILISKTMNTIDIKNWIIK